MAKLKEVLSTEVHWQVADWATRDQANIRICQLMGTDARYFAPVYVTHGGYYWSDSEPSGWTLLSDATDADAAEAANIISSLKNGALSRYPGQAARIEQIFTFPNNDFIYLRRRPDGSLDMRITGWGFANFHRAHGSGIIDGPVCDDSREVSIAFCIDSKRVPARAFEFFQGTAWSQRSTDSEGLFSFGRLKPGVSIQIRDVDTGIERIIEVDADTHHVDIDVTQYLTVRVSARLDNVPLNDVSATLDYDGHHVDMMLTMGVAECRLPWLPDKECTVALQNEHQTRKLEPETVNLFTFDFITPVEETPEVPEPESFDVSVLVIDSDNNELPKYPITIEYDGTATQHFTDENGRIDAGAMTHGQTMRVSDGTGLAFSRDYILNAAQPEYVFVLPYTACQGGDCTLRVIELNGMPSASTICVLRQPEGKHVMSALDEAGEMRFDRSDFEQGVPIDVDLYSPRRTFPKLKFGLIDNENEYELREVSGPTPWWKIAGEIMLALAGIAVLLGIAAVFINIYHKLPLFFS